MHCPPVTRQGKKASVGLNRLTPALVGCQFGFKLDPFVIVKGHIVVDHLLHLSEGKLAIMSQRFFLEMTEEALDGRIVGTIAGQLSQQLPRRDIEGRISACCVST